MTKATDWLFDQLWDTPKDKFTWYALLKEANEMQKQQIVDTWHNGYNNQSPMIDEENCGEQYYNETFKSE
jgi:hypothetical protein